MENIRNSYVGNGSLQRRHPITSSNNSMVRSSEGIYPHVHKLQGIFSLSEDVPYTSPTPCILSWKQESTVHFHQAPTSLTSLHHGTSHRCRSPYSLIPTGRVNRLPLRLSVRIDRTSADTRSCILSFGVACGITIPPLQCRGEEARFLRMLFVRFHALLPRIRGLGEETKTCP